MPGKAALILAPLLMLALSGCSGGSSAPASADPPSPPPPAPMNVVVERVFPNLSFSDPVAMLQAAGDNSRWFVVEQAGLVQVFLNDSTVASSATFIDVRGRVLSGSERGLLGLVFHPNFGANREAFLSYTRSPDGASIVSRFRSLDGGQTLDPGSEEIIIVVDQDFSNHNGGQIAFGPDGYLYVGLGDGGSGGDPNNRAQDTTNLLGNMLRLDVDGGFPYAIPPTNPFSGNAPCAPDHTSVQDCPEIYAWGFRNPWRWSFDTATGELWVGDVGQSDWEEVDLVELGENYGWDCREGANDFGNSAPSCAMAVGLIDPVAQYDHSEGQSITGGYVYRGNAIPGLVGQYVFGDFVSSTIWRLTDDGQGGFQREELLVSNLGLASFGQDADGEVYVVDYGGGLYRLESGN